MSTSDPADRIVDAAGKPARRRSADRCPQCGRGPEFRVASHVFGAAPAWPICSACNYEFVGQVFDQVKRS
jgi:ribosomal protein L37AE/L43A